MVLHGPSGSECLGIPLCHSLHPHTSHTLTTEPTHTHLSDPHPASLTHPPYQSALLPPASDITQDLVCKVSWRDCPIPHWCRNYPTPPVPGSTRPPAQPQRTFCLFVCTFHADVYSLLLCLSSLMHIESISPLLHHICSLSNYIPLTVP